MKMKIEFSMDNAAFQDGNQADEIINILDAIARIVKYAPTALEESPRMPIRDSNGNTVGHFTFTRK